MSSTTFQPDLWTLVRGTPQVDPHDLVSAIELECRRSSHDFRTRLLIRDSIGALEQHWTKDQVWDLLTPETRTFVEGVVNEDLGPAGFPTLAQRIMEKTDRETILRYLRELGGQCNAPARLELGGSGVLILDGLLRRQTDDLDVVDEIPSNLRSEFALLDTLATSYGLRLAHFQSHYLPDGWRDRLRSIGRFGRLDVFLIDSLDIVVGKLFSNRQKDRDDLRMLVDSFGKEALASRLLTAGHRLLSEPTLRANAERNWYVVFGDRLPIQTEQA